MKKITAMIAISIVGLASGCATESKRVRAGTDAPEKIVAVDSPSENTTPKLDPNSSVEKEAEKEPARVSCVNSESIACGPFSDEQIATCRKFSPQTTEAQAVCATSKWDHTFYLQILSFLDSKTPKTH